jgi:hypothetical protein
MDPRLKMRPAGAPAQVKSWPGSGTLIGLIIHPDHKASWACSRSIQPRLAGIMQAKDFDQCMYYLRQIGISDPRQAQGGGPDYLKSLSRIAHRASRIVD